MADAFAPQINPFAAPTMAASPSQSKGSTYAPATSDPETLRKRRELASRLFQAKQAGKTMGEAVSSETGVDIGNIQQGAVDMAGGTGLSESEIAGFAERLYAGKYDTAKKGSVFEQQERAAQEASKAAGAFGGDNWRGQSSTDKAMTEPLRQQASQPTQTPLLDQYAEYQKSPIGSTPMGASGLGRGPSPTGGTRIGGMSQSERMRAITANNLLRDAAERRRQQAQLTAEERGFNRIYASPKTTAL